MLFINLNLISTQTILFIIFFFIIYRRILSAINIARHLCNLIPTRKDHELAMFIHSMMKYLETLWFLIFQRFENIPHLFLTLCFSRSLTQSWSSHWWIWKCKWKTLSTFSAAAAATYSLLWLLFYTLTMKKWRDVQLYTQSIHEKFSFSFMRHALIKWKIIFKINM